MTPALMKGNDAIAEAAIRAGCKFYAGYPITPQNEIPEYMALHLPGRGGVFIQAEAELSAINMVFGAGACGVRCMTSSSSPGISLMQEAFSYIAAAELPCVVVNIVRGGPGLGNIRAAQSDYFQSVKGGGHGDYKLIVLAPATVPEAYELTMRAFDYADYYRNPVLILGDGILGQMYEPVELTEYRCSLELPAKDWIIDGCGGRPSRVVKTLQLNPTGLESTTEMLITHNLRLQEKYRRITAGLCLSEQFRTEDAEILVTAYGTSARISREAVELARERGIRAGLVRPVTLWPFPSGAFQSGAATDILVVEMSAGQYVEDVALAAAGHPRQRPRVHLLGQGGGWYPSAEDVLAEIERIVNG